MSTSFQYTPDKDQKVHGQGAISLICKPFQSHEAGLPEWAKNAADAYGRENSPASERVIVLLFSDLAKLGRPSIACLDFVGTSSKAIERYFRHWADPDAAAQGGDARVQGGHGNGGKCYMTQMFDEYAVFHTVREGVGSRYGVKGGSLKFGYVPTVEQGKDYAVPDHKAELDRALTEMGCSYEALPKAAREAFESGNGFTLVRGVGPKNYDKKIRVKDLLGMVKDHPQMLATLAYCDVFVVVNGKARAGKLSPSTIDPLPDTNEPYTIEIPQQLPDPVDGNMVATCDDGGAPGEVRLRTSQTSMRWKKKSRHMINYVAGNGFVGYKSMLQFPVQSGYRDKIYGECELEILDQYKQNDRGVLVEAPLTRAVDAFITEQIEAYAEQFESRDRQKYTKKERNALSLMNEALDRWKNRFIKDFLAGAFGSGNGPGPRPPLPAGKPARIEIRVTHSRLGMGVAIRPNIRFYDEHNRQIRPVPYRWVSEDTNVAMVDDDLMLINSYTAGTTTIYAETLDERMESNRIPIQVVRIRSVAIEPAAVEVAVGSRSQLQAVCIMSNGEEARDVALVWTEGNSSVARVSSTGMVYGVSEGSTEVIAGDDKASAEAAAGITVVESKSDSGKGKGKKPGKSPGRGYPLILVSGEVDTDPESREYVHFSPDDPPVCQRPQDADRNIWWINSAAPLARMYLDKNLGYGYESREWRMYHLERYVDIVTQIAMTYDPQITGPITVGEYFLYSADKVAEVQAAVAEELGGFIKDGEMPT